MAQEDFPPELLLYCFPGSNASCIVLRKSFWTNFGLYLVIALATLITILGNLFVIVSVCHFKQLHNPTNMFILSLALVDLLVGLFVMPFSAVSDIHLCWFYGDAFCQFHASLDFFLSTLSIFHLICIAVDRHQAICNPLHYSRRITMPVSVIMVCVIWTLAAVYTSALFYSKAALAGILDFIEGINCIGICNRIFDSLWGLLDCVFCFFFPCTVMVCLYTQIFIVAQQHVRKIGDKSNCSHDRGRGGSVKQSENKAAKTLSIVLGAFIFCWMPYFMNSIIDPLTGFRSPLELWLAFVWLGYLNSALNPLIYALFYPCFKRCFHCIVSLKIFSSNSSTLNLSVE